MTTGDAIHPPRTLDEELLGAEAPIIVSERTDPERIAAIDTELDHGFRALAHIGCGVTLFGSARLPQDDPTCRFARETARLLGKAGFSIITGGGPGVMEAGNRGARDAGAISVGLNIQLPHEQSPNCAVRRGRPVCRPWADTQVRPYITSSKLSSKASRSWRSRRASRIFSSRRKPPR